MAKIRVCASGDDGTHSNNGLLCNRNRGHKGKHKNRGHSWADKEAGERRKSAKLAKLDKTPTPMVFRADREGHVYALLVRAPGTNDTSTCTSYEHVGQHSSADYRGCIATSRPATPAEILPLRRELRSLGYRVVVRKKATWRDHEARRETAWVDLAEAERAAAVLSPAERAQAEKARKGSR